MASHSDAPSVLLHERDVVVRNQIADYLRQCGYHVLSVSRSAEARNLLMHGSRRVAVALIDVDSSGDGGFGLAAWIRKRYPDVKVLVASTFARAAQQAGDLCGDGPLARKPYDPQVLLRQIRRLLGLAGRDGQPG